MDKNLMQVWNNCLQIIRDNLDTQSYRTWFEPIKPLSLTNSVLTIQVPSQFFYEWLEDKYIDLLKSCIRRELGKEGSLEYSIVMSNSHTDKPDTVRIPTSNRSAINNPSVNMPLDINKNKTKDIPNPFVIPGLKKIKVQSQLNEGCSFDNFVEGECNRLARSAGYAVAQNPGKTAFNPMLIYSQVGLGKTHLINAIGIEVKNRFPEKTALYVSAEQFFQQFVEATRNNNQNDFVHFYQMIDVLIIDDIQFLSGKDKTQDVFFHIFNHLHQKNKQIIITCDKPPSEIVGMKQRLLSRFKWGLAADLQVPDLETRIAILKQKIYKDGIEMPFEVLEYLAYSINTNVRELEGALNSIQAQSLLNKKAITLDLAKQMIDRFVKNTNREISIDYIQKVVSDYFKLPIDVMLSKTRKREIVQARQLTMYFAKKLTKSSLATIGQQCGDKDHATVLHACRTVNNLIETDKRFKSYASELERKIKL